MKRALLLSVVASTMIMAGGDIEPVAAPIEVSNWEWSGTAKVYYQTMDHKNFVGAAFTGNPADIGPFVGSSNDMFDRYGSAADAGLQLRVSNKDVIGGFGFGAELTALNTLNLVKYGVVTGSMQSAANGAVANKPYPDLKDAADDVLSSAWVSQAYLTYGMGNTSFKVGRQELPKALSPFAFSEDWNVFKNTFEAALIVNTDITDTVLVGAYVNRANGSLSDAGSIAAITSPGIIGINPINHGAGDLADWRNVGDNGTYMLTAQNKSIEGLTATGSFYYAPAFAKNGVISGNNSYVSLLGGAPINNGDSDAMVLWGDLAYSAPDMYGLIVGAQGGFISADTDAATLATTLGDPDAHALDDTTAWGLKIGGHFADFALSAAYTSVDIDAQVPALTVTNFGTGVQSPLYTQMVLNQIFIDGHQGDSDTWQIKGAYKGLGGKFVAAYGATDVANGTNGNDKDYNEFDFIYGTKFATAYGDFGVKAMWIYQDFDWGSNNPERDDSGDHGAFIPDTNNVLRLIASYDF